MCVYRVYIHCMCMYVSIYMGYMDQTIESVLSFPLWLSESCECNWSQTGHLSCQQRFISFLSFRQALYCFQMGKALQGSSLSLERVKKKKKKTTVMLSCFYLTTAMQREWNTHGRVRFIDCYLSCVVVVVLSCLLYVWMAASHCWLGIDQWLT